ncbi:MAG TPA: hypothetical protein PKC18_13460, partial [Lacipirellulaceae bacterium]|nr:hypothetical protein [Lacipirellulaceae bacterium]
AVGNTYIKWKLDHLPAAPLTATFLAIGAAALMPLQFSPALLARMDLAGPAAPHDWPLAAASLLALGVVSTCVCIVLFVSM